MEDRVPDLLALEGEQIEMPVFIGNAQPGDTAGIAEDRGGQRRMTNQRAFACRELLRLKVNDGRLGEHRHDRVCRFPLGRR